MLYTMVNPFRYGERNETMGTLARCGFLLKTRLLPDQILGLDRLSRIWTRTVFKIFPDIPRVNGRILLVGDGIKIPKEGRKMPAVKGLHQESESNSKPAYIMGHSFQAVGVLAGALKSVFSVPLISRIHEGVTVSNRDRRTLLDKMIAIIESLGIDYPGQEQRRGVLFGHGTKYRPREKAGVWEKDQAA
jgi:hypothetical protein